MPRKHPGQQTDRTPLTLSGAPIPQGFVKVAQGLLCRPNLLIISPHKYRSLIFVFCALHSVLCTPYSLLYTLHCVLRAGCPVLGMLSPVPCTLHPVSCTFCPASILQCLITHGPECGRRPKNKKANLRSIQGSHRFTGISGASATKPSDCKLLWLASVGMLYPT
jgi:hypothetical protein